jgi:hypothetical protein
LMVVRLQLRFLLAQNPLLQMFRAWKLPTQFLIALAHWHNFSCCVSCMFASCWTTTLLRLIMCCSYSNKSLLDLPTMSALCYSFSVGMNLCTIRWMTWTFH